MTIQALLFDFDGLLIDSESAALRAWQDVYAAHGAELPLEIWHPVIGRQDSRATALDYLETLIGPYQRDALLAAWHDRHTELIAATTLRPGVADCLSTGRELGLRLAVASSATGDWVRAGLRRVGVLDQFDIIRTGDDNPAKPAPDVYLAALRALDIPASAGIAFEDSPHGITAAKAAGLFCVAVPNPVTSALPLDHADLQLVSFAELALTDLMATTFGPRAFGPAPAGPF